MTPSMIPTGTLFMNNCNLQCFHIISCTDQPSLQPSISPTSRPTAALSIQLILTATRNEEAVTTKNTHSAPTTEQRKDAGDDEAYSYDSIIIIAELALIGLLFGCLTSMLIYCCYLKKMKKKRELIRANTHTIDFTMDKITDPVVEGKRASNVVLHVIHETGTSS